MSRSLIIASLAILGVVGSLLAYDTLGYLSTALLAVLAFLLFGKPDVIYISAMSLSFLLTALVDSFHAYLISILTSFIATLYVISHQGGSKSFKVIRTLLLVFVPAYIILPRLLIPALTSSLVTLLRIIHEYLRLSKSRVHVYVSNPTTYLGAWAEIVVDVRCPDDFVYKVRVDGDTYLVGVGKGRIKEVVKVKATRLGVVRNVVKVSVSDRLELASVEHDPRIIEYTVIPRFLELFKESRRILTRYATYLSAPLILRAVTSYEHVPTAAEVSISALNVGARRVRSSRDSTVDVGASIGGEASIKYDSSKSIDHGGAGEAGNGGFKVRISWETPRELVDKVFKALGSYLGDYVGVREYQTGDNPRLIHWKKSLRRDDVEDLAVKVYSDENKEERVGWSRTIIFADLNATNPEELDLLLQTLYSYVLSLIKDSSNPLSKLYLYLITPNNETYFIEGKVIDVLLALNTLIIEGKITAQYSYNSQLRTNPPVSGVPYGVLRNLMQYYRLYGQAIISDLRSRGVEGGSLVFIYCKSLTFKYYVLSTVFGEYGFKVLTPGV